MAGVNNVNLDVLVMEITKIDNYKMSYSMRLKMSMEWQDPRIETDAFPVNSPKSRVVAGNSAGWLCRNQGRINCHVLIT